MVTLSAAVCFLKLLSEIVIKLYLVKLCEARSCTLHKEASHRQVEKMSRRCVVSQVNESS